ADRPPGSTEGECGPVIRRRPAARSGAASPPYRRAAAWPTSARYPPVRPGTLNGKRSHRDQLVGDDTGPEPIPTGSAVTRLCAMTTHTRADRRFPARWRRPALITECHPALGLILRGSPTPSAGQPGRLRQTPLPIVPILARR